MNEIEKEEELNLCPFCGGKEPMLEAGIETDMPDENESHDLFAVYCNAPSGKCGASSGWKKTKKEAVSAWNHRAKQADGWISVEERLPELDVDVLIYTREEKICPVFLWWDIGKDVIWANGDYDLEFEYEDATHWMPLPEPPKEKP